MRLTSPDTQTRTPYIKWGTNLFELPHQRQHGQHPDAHATAAGLGCQLTVDISVQCAARRLERQDLHEQVDSNNEKLVDEPCAVSTKDAWVGCPTNYPPKLDVANERIFKQQRGKWQKCVRRPVTPTNQNTHTRSHTHTRVQLHAHTHTRTHTPLQPYSVALGKVTFTARVSHPSRKY